MRSHRLAASSAILGALLLAGCGGTHGMRVTVSPAVSDEGRPVDVVVRGLTPHRRIRLVVTSTDAAGRRFAASATFAADRHGRVDLAHAAPVNGDPYSGPWQMGLLVSMTTPSATLYDFGDGPRAFRVAVREGGRQVATATFTRAISTRRLVVRRLTVARDGFQGGYAAPAGAHRLPAVLMLGGSEGGAKHPDGQLAANGIATLNVGYFQGPGLPKTLEDVPLEYFRRALLWLDRQPQVDPERVSVLGVSYGSEAALLLGVHYPQLVHAVAALATGSVVTCGIYGEHRGGGCLHSPWTFEGRPLPYTRLWNQPAPADVPAAVIPVERIKGPVLLTCGTYDQVWASCVYARAIVQRLDARHFAYPHTLYAAPGGSHFAAQDYAYWPGTLQSSRSFDPTKDERDREQLWPRLVAFLRRG